MTVSELIVKLQGFAGRGHGNDAINIPLSDPGYLGGQPRADIVGVSAGIDWDDGHVFLVPNQDIISQEKNRDVPQKVFRISYPAYNGKVKPTLACPACQGKIRKGDKYCCHCGQRVDTGHCKDIEM